MGLNYRRISTKPVIRRLVEERAKVFHYNDVYAERRSAMPKDIQRSKWCLSKDEKVRLKLEIQYIAEFIETLAEEYEKVIESECLRRCVMLEVRQSEMLCNKNRIPNSEGFTFTAIYSMDVDKERNAIKIKRINKEQKIEKVIINPEQPTQMA